MDGGEKVSEEKKKEEKDYRAIIRARAELTRKLRQRKLEKMDRKRSTTQGLRQKFAEAKRKEE